MKTLCPLADNCLALVPTVRDTPQQLVPQMLTEGPIIGRQPTAAWFVRALRISMETEREGDREQEV